MHSADKQTADKIYQNRITPSSPSRFIPATFTTEGVGVEIRNFLVLFYADDGLIVSRDPEWLQSAINCLTELFTRVGLKTNTAKTKAMVCTPRYIGNRVSSPLYRRRMTGQCQSHRERQRRRVSCSLCNKRMAHSSLRGHMASKDGAVLGDDQPTPAVAVPAQECHVSFPRHVAAVDCPCRQVLHALPSQ